VLALVATSALAVVHAQRTESGALGRLRETGKIRLGYRTDARPFSHTDESGKPAGYSIALCERMLDGLRADAGASALSPEWKPLTAADRFRAVEERQVDLLCGADSETLERRTHVDFTTPVFPGGIGAVTRADAPVRLREVLSGRGQTFRPTWRAAASQLLQAKAFTAVTGTTAEAWINERLDELQIVAKVALVPSYDDGLQRLLARQSDVLFGERAILVDAARRHRSASDLAPLDRLFTYEPLAFALARDDENFRLAVDRGLGRLYSSRQLAEVYVKWFGELDESALAFFRWNTRSE
jgi:ABC-type amino acid transport substrate-binding protein